jgi:Ca2+-binding EF-hand superfamily protein
MATKRLSLGSHFLSSKKKDDLKELFASFDKDCDGKISRPELEAMLHSAGIQITSMSKV